MPAGGGGAFSFKIVQSKSVISNVPNLLNWGGGLKFCLLIYLRKVFYVPGTVLENAEY
jgi:hypothetical protein